MLRALASQADARLVLVEAPAGYGKSILVSQWKRTDHRSFAWVSLDTSDNDPVRFWTYCLRALSEIAPVATKGLDTSVRSIGGFRNIVLPLVLNSLSDLPDRLVLVLEDYDVIRNPMCHDLLGFFIDNLPSNIQLVVTTRTDPPLHLGKLRVDDNLFELGSTDLRFDVNEAALLIRNVLGEQPSRVDVETISEKAEGWPAGIHLAARLLEEGGDVHTSLERFTGSSRSLAQYLAVEVLERQPPELHRFLRRSSILETFTAPLAVHVAGDDFSPDRLLEIERSNHFVVSLDDRREWFRYHRLFREFLASELRRSEPHLIPELHKRASEWYRNNDDVERAVHHAKEAGDFTSVGQLVWTNLLRYLNEGRFGTLERWLSELPREAIVSDPVLCLAAGWVAGFAGHLDDVEDWITAAERGDPDAPLPDGSGPVEVGIALLRATYGPIDVTAALGSARRATAGVSIDSGWTAVAFFTLGILLYASGSHEEATEALETAVSAGRYRQPVVEMISLAELSMIASEQGDRESAMTLAQQAEEVQRRSSLSQLPQSALVGAARGRVLADDGDLVGARDRLEEALELRHEYQQMSPLPTLQILITLISVTIALGNNEVARDLLGRAKTLLDFHGDVGTLAGRVHTLQRSLGVPAEPLGLFGESLTERELSVLGMLATPLSHREIGSLLFISLNTVKSHVRSLYRKLMVSSRPEALAKARDLGLL